MKFINEVAVPAEHRKSPKGKFEIIRKHVSLALGAAKDKGPWAGGHPFDVELATLPAGKCNYPLHSHAAQTEYYLVISGRGLAIDEGGQEHPLKAGDHLIVHPGEAHQLRAAEDAPLTYFIIADHHRADVTSYPRTGKRQIKPEYRVVSLTDVDYYEGEE
jgi:uncharacterized cupin superfamily protein